MDVSVFAAQRRDRLRVADQYLAPFVAQGLQAYARGEADWSDVIVEAAAQIWLENFEAEVPGRPYARPIARFRTDLADVLDLTTVPDPELEQSQTSRITKWLSTYAVNAGTTTGAFGRGVRFKRWTTMQDASVREIHEPLDGQIRPIGSTFDVAGTKLAFPGEPVGPPEVWINCVVGSTQIEGAGQSVLALTRREGGGTLVQIRTVDGHNLSITPNHPVLTPGGYVPAGKLRPGDQVMASRLPVSPEVADGPPCIEQIYAAARETGDTTRVGAEAVDFHGDAAEAEVEVVWPDGNLTLPARREAREPLLIGADRGEVPFVAVSLADAVPTVDAGLVPVGGGGLAGGDIGLSGEVAALLHAHPRHPNAVRLADGAPGDAHLVEPAIYEQGGDPEFLRNLQSAVAAGVAPTEIVEINVFPSSHPVYNLHTSQNWYSANGISVHNCRCVVMPAAREGEVMSATTYTIGPEDEVDQDNPDIIVGEDVFALQAEPDVVDEELPVDEPEDDEELITEIPVHGVLAPEGVATGDGREFALGALSTRQLPLPLRYEVTSTHGGSTSDVVTVGRIDEAWRDDDSNMWRFRGVVVLTKPHAQEVIDGIVDGTVRGTSIDGDDAEVEISPIAENPADEELIDALAAMMNPDKTVFSKMRVAGLTIVAIPAFQEAYIALGHDFQEDLSDEEIDAQVAALQACGCLDGWDIVDLSDSAEDNATAALAAELFREVDTAERERLAKEGAAMDDGSYPIANCEDLRNAIQAIGRATDPDAVKAHIARRKAALGCDEVPLPEGWSAQVVSITDPHLDGTFTISSTYAPGTKDGPGWITHPVATARIRRYWTRGAGAAKIGWGAPGDFNRCRKQLAKYVQNPDWLAGLCANMHYEALGFWPAQHHGARVIVADGSRLASPAARLTPISPAVDYPHEWFQNPSLPRALPLRIEKDTRRIYGYVAEWGTCHVGIEGFCQDVPRSYSDYGYFKKGVIDTDAGELAVGVISYGEGHADRYARIAAATAHYDQPSAVRAWVNIGEDEFGIWFAGVLAPWVSDEDITAMRAIGATSGDWREIRGQYELIGIPVVNTPGYPLKVLAASAGKQVSLIGAGALRAETEETEVTEVTLTLTTEMISDIAREARAQMRHQEELAARAAGARAVVRAQRLAAARAQLERV